MLPLVSLISNQSRNKLLLNSISNSDWAIPKLNILPPVDSLTHWEEYFSCASLYGSSYSTSIKGKVTIWYALSQVIMGLSSVREMKAVDSFVIHTESLSKPSTSTGTMLWFVSWHSVKESTAFNLTTASYPLSRSIWPCVVVILDCWNAF